MPQFALPELLKIFSFNLYTPSLFGVFGFLLFLYVVWREARKEGFDEEQVFDMALLTIAVSILFGRLSYALEAFTTLKDVIAHVARFWEYGVDPYGFILGLILSVWVAVKLKNWSLYRLADIFCLGFTIGVVPVLFSEYLVMGRPLFLYLAVFVLLSHILLVLLRKKGFVFGGLFGFTCVIFSPLAYFYFGGLKSLIFLFVLFTLGLVVLIKRLGRNRMSIVPGLNKDFLNNVKSLLMRKDKELEKEEVLLKKEDPYMAPDRDVMNNEDADEAKEDEMKETTDILTKSIEEMRKQIKRALAKLNVGTYGICEVCHKPIDPARLKAFPQATTCADCAER